MNWCQAVSSHPSVTDTTYHDDVIKWKHFPRYWPFVRGIHRWPVNSRHKGQWRGALMFSLICARVNLSEAGDLRRHRAHYGVTLMSLIHMPQTPYLRTGCGRRGGWQVLEMALYTIKKTSDQEVSTHACCHLAPPKNAHTPTNRHWHIVGGIYWSLWTLGIFSRPSLFRCHQVIPFFYF